MLRNMMFFLAATLAVNAQVIFHEGKVISVGGRKVDSGVRSRDVAQNPNFDSGVSPKIQIVPNKGIYSPSERIDFLATGFASDATNLIINIDEAFHFGLPEVPGFPPVLVEHRQYPCTCGGGNFGRVDDLSTFRFMKLFSVDATNQIGWYEFVVNILKQTGDRVDQYQVTRIRVPVLATPLDDTMRIDQFQTGTAFLGPAYGIPGYRPVLFVKGKFPVNTPLTFFMGIPPYEGMCNPGQNPPLVSADGENLTIPLAWPAQVGWLTLMLPDGSLSVRSMEFSVIQSALAQ